ncbi:MAG: response regulator [Hyphomonadaceae bacterium]|nr:response regulator [Hyphomonadaceae bacterium]
MPPKYRILVAEDDRDIRELIRTRLITAGFEVHTARNGSEALSSVSAVRPDVLVLDINMPEVDGFAVLEALGARGQLLPVLVLTARHAVDDVKRAIKLGAKDYLTKPFSEAQLQARVGRLLRLVEIGQPPTFLAD